MQSPIIHQQLILSIDRLKDLHRSMLAHSSSIPASEMENFLAEIRRVYEMSLQLNYYNALQQLNEIQIPVHAPQANSNQRTAPVSPQPVKNETPQSNGHAAPLNKDESHSREIKKEEISELPVEIPSPDANLSIDKLMSDITGNDARAGYRKTAGDLHEKFISSPSLAHSFEDHETLGKRIADKNHTHSVSDHLTKVPVKDLKVSIGLNEKFQFINHLFSGDSGKYNKAIDYLNSCGSSANANNYLKEIAGENKWEENSSQAALFIELVERRYIA